MYFFRGIAALVLALVAGVVGYEIGIQQNIAVQVPAAGVPVPYYWYGAHPFGFLGFLFPVLFFFLFVALISAAVRGAHGWGGYGGHGWGGPGGRGWGGPGHDWRRARMEELHREMHGEKPQGGGPSPQGT